MFRQIYDTIQSRLVSTLLHKFSLLFTSIYIVIFFSQAEKNKVFLAIWLSLILSFGIAGLGYLINDLHDMEQDLQSGKSNFFHQKGKVKNIVLFILFVLCAALPWLLLPFDIVTLTGITLEFVLFGLYAAPPFRLKERGILGVITDALYAHVIPLVLAGYTFSKIVPGMSVLTYHTLLFVGWLLLMGCRNILNHQLEDFENDILSGTKTVATQIGIKNLNTIIHLLIIPAEGFLFVFFLATLPFPNELIVLAYGLYILLYFIRRKKEKFYKLFFDPNSIPDKKALSSFINNNLLNEFYELHYPLVLLIYFSYYQHYFVILLLLHLFIFSPMYISFYIRRK